MKGRLPTVLSATALLIALASLTPVGQAARDKITPRARFAPTSAAQAPPCTRSFTDRRTPMRPPAGCVVSGAFG